LVRAILIALLACFATPLLAQGNYEIQVYGSDTVAAHNTMVELHSNFTFMGTKPAADSNLTSDGQVPTEHALHETLEVTRGFTGWFEIGSYLFTSYQPQNGYQFVGSHIRPRVRVPDSWKWPVGVSLSTEIGYQPPIFSPDTWSWELRPIVDKKIDRWYFAFNPTFEKSLHGPSESVGWEFTPNAKVSFDFTKKITGGVEYYGALGPVGDFDPVNQQQQMIVPAIDLDLSPRWEFNFGVGVGVTGATDHLLVKMILGRRFGKSEDKQGKEAPPVEKPPERHP
jgi:hypothetical protein